MRWTLLGAIAALALGSVTAAMPSGVKAQEKTKAFAMVPKLVGIPFYSDVETGCKDKAKKMGNVECIFTGATQVDEAEQVRVIRDLITRGVAGIAIAPNNPELWRRRSRRQSRKASPSYVRYGCTEVEAHELCRDEQPGRRRARRTGV